MLLACVVCDGVDCIPPVAELSPDSMLSWLLLQFSGHEVSDTCIHLCLQNAEQSKVNIWS